jgi:hypothetical protein
MPNVSLCPCFLFGRYRVHISARRPAILSFMVFLSPSGECRNSNLISGHGRLQIPSNSSFTYHLFIQRCIVLVAEKASLNKLQLSKVEYRWVGCLMYYCYVCFCFIVMYVVSLFSMLSYCLVCLYYLSYVCFIVLYVCFLFCLFFVIVLYVSFYCFFVCSVWVVCTCILKPATGWKPICS